MKKLSIKKLKYVLIVGVMMAPVAWTAALDKLIQTLNSGSLPMDSIKKGMETLTQFVTEDLTRNFKNYQNAWSDPATKVVDDAITTANRIAEKMGEELVVLTQTQAALERYQAELDQGSRNQTKTLKRTLSLPDLRVKDKDVVGDTKRSDTEGEVSIVEDDMTKEQLDLAYQAIDDQKEEYEPLLEYLN